MTVPGAFQRWLNLIAPRTYVTLNPSCARAHLTRRLRLRRGCLLPLLLAALFCLDFLLDFASNHLLKRLPAYRPGVESDAIFTVRPSDSSTPGRSVRPDPTAPSDCELRMWGHPTPTHSQFRLSRPISVAETSRAPPSRREKMLLPEAVRAPGCTNRRSHLRQQVGRFGRSRATWRKRHATSSNGRTPTGVAHSGLCTPDRAHRECECRRETAIDSHSHAGGPASRAPGQRPSVRHPSGRTDATGLG